MIAVDDLRHAARGLIRSPAFAVLAIGVLAIGIGANTAVFSVVNTLLLTPPPYRDPGDLVVITARSDDPTVFPGISLPDYDDFRTTAAELDDIAYLSWTVGYNLTGGSQPERVAGAWISHNLLSVLGVEPLIGRSFDETDDRPGAPGVVLLSHSLWQSRFGGDRSVSGRTVSLDGQPFTIIGVMPPDFRIGANAGLWLPVRAVMPPARRLDRSARVRTFAIGRLRAGSTVETAGRELSDMAARLAAENPETNENVSARALSFERWNSGEFVGPARILAGVVAFVLLIACANLANLLLARMPGRRHEMAVRASIGASRARLARMLLLENLVLACVAGLTGLLLAVWGVDIMNRVLPGGWVGSRIEAFSIDARVLGFTAALSLATALVFGSVPALRLSRVSLQDVLKKGGSRTGGSGNRLRGALVVGEIALALILLAGAGTLLRSLASFRSLDLGFDPSSTMTFWTELPDYRYPQPADGLLFMDRVLDGLRRDPRVVEAAAETRVGDFGTVLVARGSGADPASEPSPLASFAVSTDFFATRGMAIRRGRGFTPADRTGAPPVAIVNESLAERYWPGEDALGREIRLGEDADARWVTIVGIIGDVRQPAHTELTEIPNSVYLPIAQNPTRSLAFYVRTRSSPAAIVPSLTTIVGEVDPEQPLTLVRTMEQIVANESVDRAMMATLLGLFGTIGLALAVLGIYGVMSYAVAARTREIAIRMGLGARTTDMRRLILGEGARLMGIGVAIGLFGAWIAMRGLVASIEYIEGADPFVFGGVTLMLAAVAMIACWLPARRAMRVQPMDVLRYD